MRKLSLRWTAAPGNNEIAILWDSTRGPAKMLWGDCVASGSPYLVPGEWRHKYNASAIKGTVGVVGNDAELQLQIRTAFADAATDWEAQGGAGVGTITLTDGTPQPFDFKPQNAENRIIVTASSGAITTIYANLVVYDTTDFGTS